MTVIVSRRKASPQAARLGRRGDRRIGAVPQGEAPAPRVEAHLEDPAGRGARTRLVEAVEADDVREAEQSMLPRLGGDALA
jgi:hypothetical protein